MNTVNFQNFSPSLTPEIAKLRYEGEISLQGVSRLVEQIQSAFDYYQYDHVELHIESPGGAALGLDYLLRNISKYQSCGKTLQVRTTFLCASAAALLLAFGTWGERRVDRATVLLFHFARLGSSVTGLTAQTAGGYSRALERHDQNMLEKLVDHLCLQAGGISKLKLQVRSRLDLLDSNWADIDEEIRGVALKKNNAARPEWFKKLRAVSKPQSDISKSRALYMKYVIEAFQRDAAMDIREAFALALIDVIDDIVENDKVLEQTRSGTLETEKEGNENQAEWGNPGDELDLPNYDMI